MKNEATTSWAPPTGTLTLSDIISAPGVERVEDTSRHLDGWLVKYESPVFRAVCAAVALGDAHGHGGFGFRRPCFLYMSSELGTERNHFYPIGWEPDCGFDLSDSEHPVVQGSDPGWWAAGLSADAVFIPNCSGHCPDCGEYDDGEYIPTPSEKLSVFSGGCQGLALDHGTATGRMSWEVAADAVTIRVHRPFPPGTFSDEFAQEVRNAPADLADRDPRLRTPWDGVVAVVREAPPLTVAEVKISLDRPYGVEVWAPLHERGLRPRHVASLMLAVDTVMSIVGWEPPSGHPIEALQKLNGYFGAGYDPETGEADETPIGVLLGIHPDDPVGHTPGWFDYDPDDPEGVAICGDPEAPTRVFPPA